MGKIRNSLPMGHMKNASHDDVHDDYT
jgi:hypothetical protein